MRKDMMIMTMIKRMKKGQKIINNHLIKMIMKMKILKITMVNMKKMKNKKKMINSRIW